MKKLMIALVAVAMAAVANAAAMTWTSAAMTLADGNAAAGAAGRATAYLWVVDATTYANYTSYTTGELLTKAIVADYAGQIATEGYSATGNTAKKTGSVTLTDPADYASGNSAYAIILYKDNTASTDTYMGNIGSYKFDSSSDMDIGNMSKFIGGGDSGTSTAWVAAPEPTSGLLLLIGMAGLALRRRRA